jgi:hypothetical protein
VSSDVGYSGTPLHRKLGVKAGHTVMLDNAPAGFTLTPVPPDVVLDRSPSAADPYDVVLLFCPDAATLHARWPVVHERTTSAGALWIAWPKKAAKMATDLDDGIVRGYGLAHGRVDTKVCAVDATWSGLKFVIRLTDR